MRPAVIVLAPLLLLPFLACADTPVEPEAAETTALFKSDRPHSPGYYIEGSISCPPELEVSVDFWNVDGAPFDGDLSCYPSTGFGNMDVKKDWISITGSEVGWHLGVWEPACNDYGYINVDDLVDGRVTFPTDPNDGCYGIVSFDLRVIRVLTMK